MGFTTGFLGGLTLTYSLIYLTVYVHRSNRTYQSQLLRQHAQLLSSHYNPPEPEYEPPIYRVERAGLEEQLKDRWNREVEKVVRTVQETDWEAVRMKWEKRVGSAFESVRNTEKAQELEQRFKDTVSGSGEDQTKRVKENVKEAVQGKRLLDEN